ncbi:MAG: DNA-binding protein [Microvirga sp.]|nr:DNA-binding protein [Microvirga sp.]
MFWFDDEDVLRRADGAAFDGASWRWRVDAEGAREGGRRAVSGREAIELLAHRRALRAVPVGVIGPKVASPRQEETAAALGAALARMGLPVLCGGKTGVMAAVARGVSEAGGLCIGLLPEADWREANPHVLPIATGIGKARNVLIAQAARALIAVGGELGTLTEIAFGLHFEKPVFLLEGAPSVDGARAMGGVDDLCEALAIALLDESAMS